MPCFCEICQEETERELLNELDRLDITEIEKELEKLISEQERRELH